jgi:hypothetical protein
MSVLNYQKLDGTVQSKFALASAAGGVVLKDVSGNLVIRTTGDAAYATITASVLKVTADAGLVLNSDAAGSGADWALTVARPATGMTAAWTLTLPTSAGSPNQVLQTDGSGNTTWVDAASGATDVTDTTSFAFGSGATTAMFTLPANAIILDIGVIVDTAFDGTPSASVGISGNTSKYVGSGDINLTAAAGWWVTPNLPADTASEALIISYSAGGATTGAARVVVNYSIPS